MKDILRTKITEHKVRIEGSEISAFRSKTVARTGARVFSDGKVASAAQIGEVSEESLFSQCQANTDLALPAEIIPQSSLKKNWSFSKESRPLQDLTFEAAKESLDYLASGLPNFAITGTISSSDHSLSYSNDLGADLSVSHQMFSSGFEIRKKGSPNILDGWFGEASVLSYNKEYLDWPIELFRHFDNEVKVSPGYHKVLMVTDQSIMAKLEESLQADSYHDGSALYSGKLGSTIFNKELSVSDYRVSNQLTVFSPFDGEGTVAGVEKRTLIENGTLKALVSDLKNEKRHGVKTTANGFRQYNTSVEIGFASLSIDPGSQSYREVLSSAGDVIVVQMAAGGDLTAQGNFSSPIQVGFLCRNGEVVGRLPALTMTAHIEEILGSRLLEITNGGPSNGSPPYILTEMNILVN